MRKECGGSRQDSSKEILTTSRHHRDSVAQLQMLQTGKAYGPEYRKSTDYSYHAANTVEVHATKMMQFASQVRNIRAVFMWNGIEVN